MTLYYYCLLLVLLGVCRVSGASEICSNQVAGAINSVLENCASCQYSTWGIRVDQIYPNGTTTKLATINENKYFIPASNNKILTTSVAFFELGVNFSVTTPVYLTPVGDICLVGKGDPSISTNDLQKLAKQLYESGISKVKNVFVDNSFYTGFAVPQNWEWGDLSQSYGAQPSPLILDENTFSIFVSPSSTVGDLVSANFSYESDSTWMQLVVTATTSDSATPANIDATIEPNSPFVIYITGTLPIGSAAQTIVLATVAPAFRFATVFADSLYASQITITGNVTVAPCGSNFIMLKDSTLIGSLVSPSISEMLNWTLLTSDNIYAETFLRHLGKTIETPNSDQDTSDLGLQVVKTTLTTKFGVDENSFLQDDGSGLSRHNLVSPDSLVSTITYDYFQEDGLLYLSFFPTAGESGTLADRYINTTAQGILHAKTGSMGGVNSLSGYIDHQDDSHPILIFSIIVNNAGISSIPPIDEIGVLLASVKNC